MSYVKNYKSSKSSYHRNTRCDGFRDLFEELQTKPQPVNHYKDYSNCSKLYFKSLNNKELYYYEGLVLESGAVLIGTDVWRLTTKTDYPSHEIKVFKTLDEALKKYRIFERRF